MTDPIAILTVATRVLLVDWPTRDVPDALARAGLDVVVHGGPGPEDYFAYEVADGEVVERRVGRPPDRADVVYTYRPLDELPEIVAQARAVGAGAVWIHSGSRPTASGTRLAAGWPRRLPRRPGRWSSRPDWSTSTVRTSPTWRGAPRHPTGRTRQAACSTRCAQAVSSL